MPKLVGSWCGFSMKRFRKVIFWCHLPVGVIAGLMVLIMSVTGVLLTYERQMVTWADTRNYRVASPEPGATRLSIDTLLAKAREPQAEATPASITLRSDATMPAMVAFAGGRNLFLNPYTGEVLGEGSKAMREFFRVITDWHRWLGAKGENRSVARAITGACNLGFLFLVVSGCYLWLPRKFNWSQIKNVLWFRRGLSGKARDFNWHNTIGVWSVVPLFIIVLSAVTISYTWAGNLVYRVVGETPPAPRSPAEPSAANNNSKALPDNLDALWSRAAAQTSDWQSLSLRLPTSADTPLLFTLDAGTGGQPQKRAQLTMDGKTGEALRWEPFSSGTKGRQVRSFLRFAHTGEVAGIFGQTIAGIASLGGVFLVWTGLALSWRRWRGWRAKRAKMITPPIADLSKPLTESPIVES